MVRRAPEGREPVSQHCKIVVYLDEDDHRLMKIEAARQDRTVGAQARFYLKLALKDVKP